MAEATGKKGLAGATRTDEDHVVVLVDPEELTELLELHLTDSVLDPVVILGKIVHQRQTSDFSAPLQVGLLTPGDFSLKQIKSKVGIGRLLFPSILQDRF